MCHFVSWINYDGKNYFLQNSDLLTKEGKALKKYLGTRFHDDIQGHGAIRRYFDLPRGRGRSKEHLSLKVLPKEIVKAIKNGSMSLIGTPSSFLVTTTLCRESIKEFYRKMLPVDRKYNFLSSYYAKKSKEIFWEIFKDKKNRKKAWR